MVQVIEQQSGQRPDKPLADSAYCSEKNLEHLATADETPDPSGALRITLLRVRGYVFCSSQGKRIGSSLTAPDRRPRLESSLSVSRGPRACRIFSPRDSWVKGS